MCVEYGIGMGGGNIGLRSLPLSIFREHPGDLKHGEDTRKQVVLECTPS